MYHFAIRAIDSIIFGWGPGEVVGKEPAGILGAREADGFLHVGDIPAGRSDRLQILPEILDEHAVDEPVDDGIPIVSVLLVQVFDLSW
jgi:hypothetical protein